MSWLQAPFLLTRLQAAGWMLAILLISAGLSAWAGFSAGHDKAATAGALDLAELRLQHAVDSSISALDYATKVQERTLIAFALADDLQAERDAHSATRTALEKRIANVTTQYRKSLDQPPVPLPHCVFTAGWVQVYDASIGLPERAAADHSAAGLDGEAGAADPAAELDSGITQADILQHIGAYGQRCRDIESQLITVLDAVERQQGERP